MRADPCNERHHLRRNRGCWQLRFTLKTEHNMVGRRVVCGLNTHDEDEARVRRDIVLRALSKADLLEMHSDMAEVMEKE
ncbi:hypothetical protein [Luteolibacter luteus]|uniref:Integrase n=1 Tax=Luteolibacter luteus TaxID=2728835 RepID=A0A858RSD6_9BACT|nr:hypothetical protein [Luteolibacter luteus]QJE99100.1 hypothetical protein HHL09_26080 [Luteolibacter luteus]